MCPYLIYDDQGMGVCSLRGLTLSPFKTSGYCETSSYSECDAYFQSDTSFDEDEEFPW